VVDGHFQRLHTKRRSLRMRSPALKVGDLVAWGGRGPGGIERTGTVIKLGLPGDRVEVVQHAVGRIWTMPVLNLRRL
jgi:hypothetical protein